MYYILCIVFDKYHVFLDCIFFETHSHGIPTFGVVTESRNLDWRWWWQAMDWSKFVLHVWKVWVIFINFSIVKAAMVHGLSLRGSALPSVTLLLVAAWRKPFGCRTSCSTISGQHHLNFCSIQQAYPKMLVDHNNIDQKILNFFKHYLEVDLHPTAAGSDTLSMDRAPLVAAGLGLAAALAALHWQWLRRPAIRIAKSILNHEPFVVWLMQEEIYRIWILCNQGIPRLYLVKPKMIFAEPKSSFELTGLCSWKRGIKMDKWIKHRPRVVWAAK